jgi:hypothetical protein
MAADGLELRRKVGDARRDLKVAMMDNWWKRQGVVDTQPHWNWQTAGNKREMDEASETHVNKSLAQTVSSEPSSESYGV